MTISMWYNKKERRSYAVDEKSIPVSKIEVSGQWATLFHSTRLLLGSYSVIIAPMAASKEGP
jgi:hypothetical protein